MKILFACDSLYADVSKKVLSHNLNSRILHLRIPGSGIRELSMSVVYRVRAMHHPAKILLISVGSNDMKLDILDFYCEVKKLLAFCVERDMLFLFLPIPYSGLSKHSKTDEFNKIINNFFILQVQFGLPKFRFGKRQFTSDQQVYYREAKNYQSRF